MPITPLHWPLPAFLGLKLDRWLNTFCLLLGATVIDLEVVWIILFNKEVIHGFFHSFFGAMLLVIPVSLAAYFLSSAIDRFLVLPMFWTPSKLSTAFLSVAIGAYSHVLLDAICYPELNPFLFSNLNPFYVGLSTGYALALFFSLPLLVLIYRRSKGDGPEKPLRPPSKDSWITTKKVVVLILLTLVVIEAVGAFFPSSPRLGEVSLESGTISDEHLLYAQIRIVSDPTLTAEDIEIELFHSGKEIFLTSGRVIVSSTGFLVHGYAYLDGQPSGQVLVMLFVKDAHGLSRHLVEIQRFEIL